MSPAMHMGLYHGLLLALSCICVNSQLRSSSRTYTREEAFSSASSALPNGWEEWSEWSDCSRSCGGGITEQRRNCRGRLGQINHNASNWQCSGSNKRYRSCNTIPCPDGSINSRRAKCADYNTRLFSGITYTWEPMIRGGPCELNCRARGHRFFIRHTSRVTDGTDCSYSMRAINSRTTKARMPKHLCVDGRCLKVGCDGHINSKLTVDKCGVCGGNEQSCRVVEGLFRLQNLANDFHVVTTIPAGATRINITEVRDSRSYLALRSAKPEGGFYINRGLKLGQPDPTSTTVVAGALFIYSRPFKQQQGESILSSGPTNEPLVVLLYFQGKNPGIRFEYVIPKPTPSPNEATHRNTDLDDSRHDLLDQHGDPQPTNGRQGSHIGVSENFGHHRRIGNPTRFVPTNMGGRFFHQSARFSGINNPRFRIPGPTHPNNNGRSLLRGRGEIANSGINERYPYWSRRSGSLDATENEYDMEARDEESTNTRRDTVNVHRKLPDMIGETAWRAQGFGPCSKSCAEGKRSTVIRCVKLETNEEIDEQYCSGSRPRIRTRKCNRQPCPAHYYFGKWSQCSRTCGNGRRTRSVICRQHFAGNFTTAVSHKRCRGLPRPITHEKCKVRDCARWMVTREWSKCNVKCGTGKQMRRAVCKGGSGVTLPDGRCPIARRPSNIKSCDAGPCVTKWYVTIWEECSADCDRGVQRRNVYCLNTAGAAEGCSSEIEPVSTRTCARSSCGIKHEWFAGAWGPCSSKCGNGVQERKVTCLNITTDGEMSVAEPRNGILPCEAADKPTTQQTCNTQSCGSRWHYTPWTECSVSCGGGSRTRDIQCLDADGSYSSLCNIGNRPIEAERCNTASCVSLIEPGCIDHSYRCKQVLKARLCVYRVYRKRCCHTCSVSRMRRPLLP